MQEDVSRFTFIIKIAYRNIFDYFSAMYKILKSKIVVNFKTLLIRLLCMCLCSYVCVYVCVSMSTCVWVLVSVIRHRTKEALECPSVSLSSVT